MHDVRGTKEEIWCDSGKQHKYCYLPLFAFEIFMRIYLYFHITSTMLNNRFIRFNQLPAKLPYLNCHPLEMVSRYREPQLQVGKKYSYLFNLSKKMLIMMLPITAI